MFMSHGGQYMMTPACASSRCFACMVSGPAMRSESVGLRGLCFTLIPWLVGMTRAPAATPAM
eukprot:719149-Pyramimonas_sp.AAC.2